MAAVTDATPFPQSRFTSQGMTTRETMPQTRDGSFNKASDQPEVCSSSQVQMFIGTLFAPSPAAGEHPRKIC